VNKLISETEDYTKPPTARSAFFQKPTIVLW